MVLKVQCDSCSARYKLDETRIKGKGARITCPKCGHQFVVYKQDLVNPNFDDDDEPVTIVAPQESIFPPQALKADAEPAPTSKSGVARPTNVNDLNWREVGLTSFKVKVSFGLVYDFSDVATLKRYIGDKKVQATDSLSFDGRTWKTLAEIRDLDAFFIDKWMELKAGHSAKDTGSAPKAPAAFIPPAEAARERPLQREKTPDRSPISKGLTDTLGDGLGDDLFGDLTSDDDEGDDDVPVSTASRTPMRSTRTLAPEDDEADLAGPTTPRPPPAPAMRPGEIAVLAVLLVIAAGLGWAFAGVSKAGVGDEAAQVTVDNSRRLQEQVGAMYPSLTAAGLLNGQAPSAKPPPPEAPRPEELQVPPPPVVEEAAPPEGAAPERPNEKKAAGKPKGKGDGQGVKTASISASDLVELGDAQLSGGDAKGAVASYTRAAEMEPKNARTQVKLGHALLLSGAPAKAEAALKRGLAMDNSQADAHKWLGEALERQGRKQDAAAAYQRYLDARPQAKDRADIEARIAKLG